MIDPSKGGTSGRAVLILGLIFVFGMIAGASLFYVGQRSVAPRRPHDGRPPREGQRPPDPLADMTERLGLTDRQRDQIRQILHAYRDRMDGMLEESRVAIREVLTEEQRQLFDDMRPPRLEGRRPPPPGPRRKGPPPPGRSP